MRRGWVWNCDKVTSSLAIAAAFALCATAPAFAADPIKIGHVAALSGASAQSGEAITRGLLLAIDEINAKGGLLGGRMLELVQRDDELTPPKGLVAARELMSQNVAAVFGGIDTPVSLAMVPVLNKEKCIYMGVWAAGTGITHNGANPNYAFRVSAVDALVDVKLLKFAHQKFGAKKAGLMLINNPWGQGNEKGLLAASKADPTVEIAGVEKFENNDVDMVPQLTRLKDAGADCIILVVNAAARCASDEIARAHGLDRSSDLALGHLRRTLSGTCRTDRGRSRFRPDLQLLRQAGAGRRAGSSGAREEIPAGQRSARRIRAGRNCERL